MAVPAHQLAPQHTPRHASPRVGRPSLHLVPSAGGRARGSRAAHRPLTVLAVLLMVVVGVWAAGGLVGASPSYLDARAVETVVLGEGDTVWEIAADHVPAGADLRAYVAEVIAFNGVRATSLQPGTVLRLP